VKLHFFMNFFLSFPPFFHYVFASRNRFDRFLPNRGDRLKASLFPNRHMDQTGIPPTI